MKPKELKTYFCGIKEILSIIWSADKKLTLLIILNSFARNITRPLRAVAIKYIVDLIVLSNSSGYTGEAGRKFCILIGVFFILFALNRIWWPLNSYTQTLMLARIGFEIKSRIITVIDKVSISFFDDTYCYDLLNKANGEVSGRRPIVAINSVVDTVTNLISFSIAFIPMVVFDPLLSLLLLLSALPGIWAENHFGKKFYDLENEKALIQRRKDYTFNLFINKVSAKDINLNKTSDYLINKYNEDYDSYNKAYLKVFWSKLLVDMPFWMILQCVILFAYYNFISSVGKGTLEIGQMSYFLAVIMQITWGINMIGNSVNSTLQSSRFANNLVDLYNNEYLENEEAIVHVPSKINDIQFKNVWFKYPNSDKYILKNINFEITVPEHIAIVGLNGAGKTTLIKLILGFYTPTKGEILCNGININNFSMEEWREKISSCFQDYVNYAFTVKECVKIGNLNAQEKEVIETLKTVGIYDSMNALKDGLDTYLSKNFDNGGTELSGGQYNKIALARAFIKWSEVIILDEPTAALDARAEAELYDLFDKLTKDKLGIMITHRFGSTLNADHIMVLSNGEIIEYGTHHELMQKGGEYAEMFNMQAKQYKEAEAL